MLVYCMVIILCSPWTNQGGFLELDDLNHLVLGRDTRGNYVLLVMQGPLIPPHRVRKRERPQVRSRSRYDEQL